MVRDTESADASIGDRIRRARKRLGISQAELAQKVGVSQPAIATWESGQHDPRRLALARLSEALSTPLEWLAAGARSPVETDRHPAAAYLRRGIHHVPVISPRSVLLIAHEPDADPHAMAEDYIPVTAGAGRFFALFVDDVAVNLAFPAGSLVVVDYTDRDPEDGAFCLAVVDSAPTIRRWRSKPDRLEPYSSDDRFETIMEDQAFAIVGAVKVSIRVHL